MLRLSCLGLLVFIASACGPNPMAPVKVMAIIPDETGTYGPRGVELRTVTNVTTLEGELFDFIGSTRVVVDPTDPTQQLNGGVQNLTDEQRYDLLVRIKGGPVRGHYVARADVLWPEDFHTWNMVTAFYNFERAYEYFQFAYDGQDPEELRAQRIHYWSDLFINDTSTPIVDNTLYLSFIKSFVITPFVENDKVPLPMNIGVVGHEYAHRAFNFRALRNEGLHPALSTWSLEAFNWLKSLDEGLADFHGFSVTCDELARCRPNFLAESLTDDRVSAFRNLARNDACMDAPTLTELRNAPQNQWVASPNLYKVGNLVAASLYQAGFKTGKVEILQKAVIAALDDESPVTPGLRQLIEANESDASLAQRNFTPEATVDIIAAHISDPELKKVWCTEASTRLQLRCGVWPCEVDGKEAMTHCPSTARRENTCPLIDQP